MQLCVSVAGLGERKNRMIEHRIRANATLLGLKLAKSKCSPNAVVIVTDQPNGRYSALRKKRRGLSAWRPSPCVSHVARSILVTSCRSRRRTYAASGSPLRVMRCISRA